eukprot:jgi/Picsp_1/2486/NSC_00718-R1_mitogen-activated protein
MSQRPVGECLQIDGLYKVLEISGEGTYGKVYKCAVQGSNDVVAIKKFKKHDDRSGTCHRNGNRKSMDTKLTCCRELMMLKMVSEIRPHVNIIKLLDYFNTQGGNFCMVFEHIKQNLLEIIDHNPRGVSEIEAKRLIWQLLQAVEVLHGMNIMHRDLKPENILVSDKGILKLCDFGFARHDILSGSEEQDSVQMTQYVATRWYRAPELLLSSLQYSKKIDIWSIGCLTFELLTGQVAFPGQNDIDQIRIVAETVGPPPDHVFPGSKYLAFYKKSCGKTPESKKYKEKSFHTSLNNLPLMAQSFIKSCLQVDPSKRSDICSLLSHSWLHSKDEWASTIFQNDLKESINNIKDLQSLVLAKKRLKMATAEKRCNFGSPKVSLGRVDNCSVYHTPVMRSCSPSNGTSSQRGLRTDGYQLQKLKAADHKMSRTPKERYRVTEIIKETISLSHASFSCRQQPKFENRKVDQEKHFACQNIEAKSYAQQEGGIFLDIKADKKSGDAITSKEVSKDSLVAIRQVGDSQKPMLREKQKQKLAQWTRVFPLKYLNWS